MIDLLHSLIPKVLILGISCTSPYMTLGGICNVFHRDVVHSFLIDVLLV